MHLSNFFPFHSKLDQSSEMDVYVVWDAYASGGKIMAIYRDLKTVKQNHRRIWDKYFSTKRKEKCEMFFTKEKDKKIVNQQRRQLCNPCITKVKLDAKVDDIFLVNYSETSEGGSYHSDWRVLVSSDFQTAVETAYEEYKYAFESSEEKLLTKEKFTKVITTESIIMFPNDPYEASISVEKVAVK